MLVRSLCVHQVDERLADFNRVETRLNLARLEVLDLCFINEHVRLWLLLLGRD